MFVLDLSVRKRNRDDETQPFTPRLYEELPLAMQTDHVDATPSTLWVAARVDSVTSTPLVVEPLAPSMLSMPSMPPLLTPLHPPQAPSMPPLSGLPPLLSNPLPSEQQVNETVDVSEVWRHAGLMRELGGVKKSASRR